MDIGSSSEHTACFYICTSRVKTLVSRQLAIANYYQTAVKAETLDFSFMYFTENS